MKQRPSTKFVHAGGYAAEVDVVLLEEDHEWAPYLSLDDAMKLDAVRAALKAGDIASASKLARVYELKPVAAE